MFLILKRIGTDTTDLEVVGLVESKSKENAINDFGPQDEGEYVAVPYSPDEIDRQRVQKTFTLEPIVPSEDDTSSILIPASDK